MSQIIYYFFFVTSIQAIAGCGESALDKAFRETGESFLKAGAASEKPINSMKIDLDFRISTIKFEDALG